MNTHLLAQNLSVPKPQSFPDPAECFKLKVLYESIFGLLFVSIIILLFILLRHRSKSKVQSIITWTVKTILFIGLIGLMLLIIVFPQLRCVQKLLISQKIPQKRGQEKSVYGCQKSCYFKNNEKDQILHSPASKQEGLISVRTVFATTQT